MIPKVVILGAGGGSRDVLDIFDACNAIHPAYSVEGFIVDPEYATPGIQFNDKPVLGGFEWLAEHHHDVQAICGVGSPELRQRLIKRAEALGVTFCTVIHPSVQMTRWVRIGAGSSIAAGCVLTNQIKMGDHVQVNVGCTISHDVILENFVTLSPGVHIAGNVHVGEGCFIGIGASCIEKKRIGVWSVIGAGAVIIDNVPPNTTVVGVPGKVIKTHPEGWHLA